MTQNPPSIGQTIVVIVVLLVAGPVLSLMFGLLRLILACVYSLLAGGDLNFNRWIEYGQWREKKLEPWISKLGLKREGEVPGILEALQAIPKDKYDKLHAVGIERTFSTSIRGHQAFIVDVSRRGKVDELEMWATIVEFFLPRSWTLATGNDLQRITVVAVQIARIGHPRCNVRRSTVSEELEINLMPETILTAEQKQVLDGYPLRSFERITAHEDWLLFCSAAMSPAAMTPWMLENSEAFLSLRETGEISDVLRARNRNRIGLELPALGQPVVTVVTLTILIGLLSLAGVCIPKDPWLNHVIDGAACAVCGLIVLMNGILYWRWIGRRNRIRDEDPELVGR